MNQLLTAKFDSFVNESKELSRNQTEKREKELFTFDEFCTIVVYFIHRFSSKVINSIKQPSSKVFFLLGTTGVGKTTFALSMCGTLDDPEQSKLVEHSPKNSGTFEPNVFHVDGLGYMVDFNGFEDSRGTMMNLAVEATIRLLAERYQPIISVLGSVGHIENGYMVAFELNQRLCRLFDSISNTDIILCLTKYEKLYENIRIVEETKKYIKLANQPFKKSSNAVSQLCTIKTLKKFLKKNIESLSGPAIESIKQSIDKHEQELIQLQHDYRLNQNRELNEIWKKIEYLDSEVRGIESDWLREIGLKVLMRLKNVNDPKVRKIIINTFASFQNSVPIAIQRKMQNCDVSFVFEIFEKSCFEFIQTESFSFMDCDESSFFRCIKESGLVQTLMAVAHPSITEYLNHSTTDPVLAQRFTNKIVESTINDYKKSIKSCINVKLIFNDKKLIKLHPVLIAFIMEALMFEDRLRIQATQDQQSLINDFHCWSHRKNMDFFKSIDLPPWCLRVIKPTIVCVLDPLCHKKHSIEQTIKFLDQSIKIIKFLIHLRSFVKIV